MKLEALFAHLGPLLEGRASLEQTQRALFGGSASVDAQRLGLYQRMCRSHRDAATGGVHSELRALVQREAGEDAWLQLVEDYFAARPMHSVELNENGAQLAGWLAGRPELPALWAALADFEWWEWQTYVAPDSADDARGTEAPLRLASTVELRPYAFDLVGWLDAETRAPAPQARDVVVLFWRTATLRARRELVTPRELWVLKAVSEGQRPDDAEVLADLQAAGVVLGR